MTDITKDLETVDSEPEEDVIHWTKNYKALNFPGERLTNRTNKRGPLIRSEPSSWSETSRRNKRIKNQQVEYKRSRESGSSGPERKIRKRSIYRVNKRILSSNDTINVLPKYRKIGRAEKIVAASTSRYNLRPRGGIEVES
ncbi:uncharacterized protein TNCV_3183911 [Trichonephila clavipes]|nr:uncharacterized protein TNCV_3183911 [Trichonephila clavipes]